jgi:diguanylate cyclase (GGDEF)-like protein
MTENRHLLKLKASAAPAPQVKALRRDWRILVVDDDEEIHSVTRMILGRKQFKGRGIELLSATSAAEAQAILEREKDIAAILLDVVMESDDAGLQLVQTIRGELDNQLVRIILRTGQPGQAPEERVIVDYDINDYKAKSELTAQKLFTTVIAALRAYETIVSLDKTRKGLEKILDSTSTLFQVESIQHFASGVLSQLSAFLDCQPNGVICAQFDPEVPHPGSASCQHMQLLAASGEYGDCISCLTDDSCRHHEMMQLIRLSLAEHKSQLTDQYTVLYFETGEANASAALLHGGLWAAEESDRKLLEVFSSKISIALANALNYQKMISAERAATTDFLTGLNNRRQLLRLGIPMVAGAFRADTPLAVAMLDIDHFKQVNDTMGHDAGDEVLIQVGMLLRERFRTSDVVARFGGEEFCVIAANLTPEVARVLFDNFRRALEEMICEIRGKRVPLTISIGVTTLVVNSVDAMISAADRLLYRAKQEGRNRVVIG